MKQTLTKLLGSALTLLFLVPNMANATITATWDWVTNGDLQSVSFNGTSGYIESSKSGVSMYVDATNGKLTGSTSGHAQFNEGTKLRIPVVSTSDVVTFIANSYNYKGVTIGNEDFEAGSPAILTRTHTATAEDVAQGYVLITSKGDYLNTVSVELAYLPPTPKSATWDFTKGSSIESTILSYSGTINDQTISINDIVMTVNAHGKTMGYDGANRFYTYNGVVFHVPVISTEDVVTVTGYSSSGTPYYFIGGTEYSALVQDYYPTPSDVDQGYVEIINGKDTYSFLKSISVKQKSQTTLSVSTYKWATFNNANYALDFSNAKDAINAYMVTGREGTAITKTAVTGTLPKNTGLLINGDAGTYAIAIVSSSNTDVSSNLMKPGTGADVSAESGKTKYVLGVNGEEAQFLKINATKATVSADKAYLEFNEEINASALIFDGSFDNTTSIESIQATMAENEVFFNLAGQRVAQPTKGLYIVNGKKVIIK